MSMNKAPDAPTSWFPVIYLKNTIVEDDRNYSLLVHEAAHALHFFKDVYEGHRLSQRWHFLFPNERKGRATDDPCFLEESGVLVPYAARNYCLDEVAILQLPLGLPDASYTYHKVLLNGMQDWVKIDFFGARDYDAATSYLFQKRQQLPGRLISAVSHIVIGPGLTVDGFCSIAPGFAGDLNWMVAEDIATHTSIFHAAFMKPKFYRKVTDKIKRNRLTRQRLEVLVEEGFLDPGAVRLIR